MIAQGSLVPDILRNPQHQCRNHPSPKRTTAARRSDHDRGRGHEERSVDAPHPLENPPASTHRDKLHCPRYSTYDRQAKLHGLQGGEGLSAWRIGAGSDDLADAREAGNTLKRFIDKITLWIPGDVVVIYVAGVTALLTQSNKPNVVWLVVMAVVTLVYVPFAAWVARKEITGAVWARALLAVVAFLIWSLTVPGSGWHELEAVAKNPGWVALIANPRWTDLRPSCRAGRSDELKPEREPSRPVWSCAFRTSTTSWGSCTPSGMGPISSEEAHSGLQIGFRQRRLPATKRKGPEHSAVTSSDCLLDGHALGEVPRLVDVASPHLGDVVREQLERRRHHHRREQLRHPRNEEHVLRVRRNLLVALAPHGDHVRAARADLLDVREHLGVDVAFRRHGHDRHPLLDQRDRPVLQLTGRVALRVQVTDLLQLQRALERCREAGVAADEQDVARPVDLLGDPADLLVERKRSPHLVWKRPQTRDDVGDLLGKHWTTHLREVQRDKVQRNHLRGERLRRGDADLRPGVGVHHGVGLTGQRGSERVRHGEHARTLPGGVTGRLERVDGLPRLTHRERQRVGSEHGVAIPELRRDVDLDRQPGPVLDGVLRDEPRVVRRPTGDHEDLVHVAQDVLVDVELVEREQPAFVQTPHKRVADRGRLLVDLLAHEVVVTALLRTYDVPVHLERLDRYLGAVEVGHSDRVGANLDHTSFVDRKDATGSLEHRRDVRGEHVLALPETDDERGRHLHTDDDVGIVGRDDDERERPLELSYDLPHAVGKRTRTLLEHVRDDLRVGIRTHQMTALLEARTELGVVLDDAVVDHRDAAIAIGVRVRVLVRRRSVRRPPRVPDAHGAARRPAIVERSVELGKLAGALHHGEVVVEKRDAGRVVPPVLETPETLEDDRERSVGADIAHDAAHGNGSLSTGLRESLRRKD